MNIVTLLGRLVANPETRYTNNGAAVTSFKIAVAKPVKEQDPDFINCQAWNKAGETIQSHFTKGQRILIRGKLNIQTWKTQDGTTKEKAVVTVDDFEFIEKKENNNTYQQSGSVAPASRPAATKPNSVNQPKPANKPPVQKEEPASDTDWLMEDDTEEMPE